MGSLFIVLGVIFVLSFVPLIFLLGRGYVRYHGTRSVTCPQNGQLVKVRLNARRAAVSSVSGEPDLQVAACDRWPERKDCSQGCVGDAVTAHPNVQAAAAKS